MTDGYGSSGHLPLFGPDSPKVRFFAKKVAISLLGVFVELMSNYSTVFVKNNFLFNTVHESYSFSLCLFRKDEF